MHEIESNKVHLRNGWICYFYFKTDGYAFVLSDFWSEKILIKTLLWRDSFDGVQ